MTLVCYLYYEEAIGQVLDLIARLRKHLDVSRVLIVYDQRRLRGEDLVTSDAQVRVLPYAGDDWEFGAYQLGLDESDWRRGGLVFLNDTVGRNYPFFAGDLRRFADGCRTAAASDGPVVVGKIEQSTCAYSLLGREFDAWIRSNIFYLNAPALDAIGAELFDAAVFRAPVVEDGRLRVGLPVSPELEAHLLNWLSPSAGKAGWLAHARQTAADPAVLRGKLGSILLEKHLSARLRAAQAKFVSYEPVGTSPVHALAVWLFFKRRGWLRRTSQRRTDQRASS